MHGGGSRCRITRAFRAIRRIGRAVSRPEVLRWFSKPGGESQSFNMLADLGRIRCPTLVLGGEDDPIHPIESQADIAAALPPHLVQFERFADCRHAVIPDAPERAFAVIRDFITAVKMKPAPEGAGINSAKLRASLTSSRSAP